MANFLHVFARPKPASSVEEIETVLNKALDWYRYYEGVYVVRTAKSPEVWRTRLEPLVQPEGDLFIAKLDLSEKQGWMNKAFWDWLEANLKKEGGS